MNDDDARPKAPRGGEWTYANELASGLKPFTLRFLEDEVDELDQLRGPLSRTDYLRRVWRAHVEQQRALAAAPAARPRARRRAGGGS